MCSVAFMISVYCSVYAKVCTVTSTIKCIHISYLLLPQPYRAELVFHSLLCLKWELPMVTNAGCIGLD